MHPNRFKKFQLQQGIMVARIDSEKQRTSNSNTINALVLHWWRKAPWNKKTHTNLEALACHPPLTPPASTLVCTASMYCKTGRAAVPRGKPHNHTVHTERVLYKLSQGEQDFPHAHAGKRIGRLKKAATNSFEGIQGSMDSWSAWRLTTLRLLYDQRSKASIARLFGTCLISKRQDTSAGRLSTTSPFPKCNRKWQPPSPRRLVLWEDLPHNLHQRPGTVDICRSHRSWFHGMSQKVSPLNFSPGSEYS